MKLYRGDCLEIMKELPAKSIDMVLCDLPYGTTNCRWDTIIPFEELWQQYKRIVKDNGAIVLFGSQPFTSCLVASNLQMFKYEWIWEKTTATGHLNAKKMPMKAHENILVFYKKQPTYNPQKTEGHKPVNTYTKYITTQNTGEIYGKVGKEVKGGGNTDRYPRSIQVFASDKQKSHLHPTQKPIELCRYMIRTYSNEGDVILDNCMGSGTTGAAAILEGREFIGIEKDEDIFQIAKKRIESMIAGG